LVIFLEVLSCFAFGNNWMPLVILVPMALTPLPMLLVTLCSSDDMFSGQSRGQHWAEFLTAFLFTGCFAIPILLGITKEIEWGAAAVSLVGTLLMTAIFGVRMYLKHKDNDSFNINM